MARKQLPPRKIAAIECLGYDLAEFGEAARAASHAIANFASALPLAALDEIEHSERFGELE